ncbi:MAG: aminotransferase class I/II-fold pyridoxal phosphate-dependent enzyme [bacterium]
MENLRLTGDMSNDEFIEYGNKMVKIIADYLNNIETYDVLPKILPGDCFKHFDELPPQTGTNFHLLLNSLDEKIFKNATHWNHPGFMAYFNSTSSGPGILAEFLSAALNTNGMVWKSSPINTELETIVIKWMQKMLGLPDNFFGIIYDTASVSTFHGLAAAREKVFQDNNNYDLNINTFTVYCSEHSHSSVEKDCLALGLRKIRKISSNKVFEINITELKDKIEDDLKSGFIPMAVVASVGTTSVTSIDDVKSVSDLCIKHNIWLHVDSAHAGIAAIADEYRHILNNCNLADSIVINPHKWMFTPVDLSLLYIKEKHYLKDAFSIIPEYLKSNVDEQVINYTQLML